METLSGLESFVRSAEAGSFSEAARRLGLTPAAVSKNVAALESSLGVRLFQRSTRRLTLTESGERFLHTVSGGLETIRAAIAGMATRDGEPAGVLRISMQLAFGLEYVLPLMPAFLARYPAVTPEWQFENRQVDLIAEGIDVAIGGGIDLAPGVVARELAPANLVAVASPAYLEGRTLPSSPGELAAFDGIVMRSVPSGRVRTRPMRNAAGAEAHVELRARMIVNDPEAVCRCALLGMGVALVAMPHAAAHLREGALTRLVPGWYADAGPISLYFASQKLLPAKTRVFIDYLIAQFRERGIARRLSAADA